MTDNKKRKKREISEKAKALAHNIVLQAQTNRFKNLKELLIGSGYSESMARGNPGKIIAQRSIQEYLIKIGFNETAIKAILTEVLLLGSELGRLRAADQMSKILGIYAPEKKEVRGLFYHILKEVQSEDNGKDLVAGGSKDSDTSNTGGIGGAGQDSGRDIIKEFKEQALEVK